MATGRPRSTDGTATGASVGAPDTAPAESEALSGVQGVPSTDQDAVVATPEDAPNPGATVEVEFVGSKPYGREFISERRINRKDLKGIGIESEGDLVFSASNGWKQTISADNEALVGYFDKADSDFKVL